MHFFTDEEQIYNFYYKGLFFWEFMGGCYIYPGESHPHSLVTIYVHRTGEVVQVIKMRVEEKDVIRECPLPKIQFVRLKAKKNLWIGRWNFSANFLLLPRLIITMCPLKWQIFRAGDRLAIPQNSRWGAGQPIVGQTLRGLQIGASTK